MTMAHLNLRCGVTNWRTRKHQNQGSDRALAPVDRSERIMTMKNNRESIIRISPYLNPKATLLELPGPEYSSHDDERLGHVRRLIQDLAEKADRQYLVIDLSRVHFFGASFIGILVNAWDQLKGSQRHLAICDLTPYCAKL